MALCHYLDLCLFSYVYFVASRARSDERKARHDLFATQRDITQAVKAIIKPLHCMFKCVLAVRSKKTKKTKNHSPSSLWCCSAASGRE